MSTPSPEFNRSALVTFSIKVGSEKIKDTFQVVSIDTWVRLNKIPKARIVLFDGSPAEADFPLSNLDTFIPGKQISIAVGYDSKNTQIFKGVIVKQGIEIDQSRGSKLVVDIVDEAIKMTLERKNGVFEKAKDSALISELIKQNGLKPSVTATNVVHETVIQYYASDWDLMLSRAEMNSFVVTVDDGKVSVKKPNTNQKPALQVKYGESILDLQAEMNAATQYDSKAINSYTWDIATQKVIDSGPSSVNVIEPGNLSSEDLAKVFKVKKFTLQTGGTIQKTSLKDWSSAELLKTKLSKIKGTVRFQGNAKVKTSGMLELTGVGQRFNGRVFVSGVHHFIHNGKWLTTAQFGMSSKWFAVETPDIAAPDASGQLPPIKGLQTGIVKQVDKDPDGEYRVLVNLPLLQDNSKNLWARLGNFYASNKVGALFYPEVDDEVIVGFMNEDPRYAVILGSVYSKKMAPPYPPDKQNTKKAIVTKNKLEIYLDDKDKIIEIKTPGKHVIKMDDKAGAISIKDSNKNTISLSKGGITMDSGSNIKITAKGNITLDAKGNLKMAAAANASLEGLQVANKAKAKFSAKGSASAEVTSSGILTVRGTLVKIN